MTLPRYAARQAEICLNLLSEVAQGISEGQPADRILHNHLRQHREFGSRDRRFFADAIFCWLRWYGRVREIPAERGLLIAWHLDGNTEWPVALQALAEQENFDITAEVFEDEIPDSASSLLPEWLKELCPDEFTWEDAIRSHVKRPPTWLRVDRTAGAEVHEALVASGGEAHDNAYRFENPAAVNQAMRDHSKFVEIQDISSQQVVRVCAPKSGEFWWDACCGTGGKSLQLLDEGERNLDLTATDRREKVFDELKKRARRHGLGKIRHYALDPTKKDALLPNIEFDGILIDAPCTGSGTWSRNPDGPWRCSGKDVRQLAKRQQALLESCGKAIKADGRMVYAVCSYTTAETTGVVDAFLAANPEWKLQPFSHPLTGDETDGKTLITPDQGQGDAMFIAVFTK